MNLNKLARQFALILFVALIAVRGYSVDFTTISNSVMCGYQGWHWAKGDGSPANKWGHWVTNSNVRPGPTNVHMDMFPDMTEYTKTYATGFQTPGGTPLTVFSAVDFSTVNLHFKWMKDYNIDGAFVQRFVSNFKSYGTSAQNIDIVLSNCWRAAESNGRSFVVMYDVSDTFNNDAQLYNTITTDWMQRARKYTNSPNYQHHKGKPLAVVWGMGINNRWPSNPVVALNIVNFFKTNGCTVMGGVDDGWRTLSGCRNNVEDGVSWSNVNHAYDVISPWLVGTIGSGTNSADGIRSKLAADFQDCDARNADYMPVAFPGFSWSNWKANSPFNERPRLGGEYLWRQAFNAKDTGSRMLYLAMFDEVDEATALFKTTATAATSPQDGIVPGYGSNRWVRLDVDGVSLPSDWYLQVCGEINRMFKGERPPVAALPIAPNTPPTITSTPTTNAYNGYLYQYTLLATDTGTNALSYSAITKPAWLNFNTNTALLSGTPSSGNLGSHAVTLRVSDSVFTTNQSFTIWVTNFPNTPPTITSTPSTNTYVARLYQYTLTATDTGTNALIFSAITLPAWLSFNTNTALLSGTPSLSDLGTHPVTLRVSDSVFTTNQSFTLWVTTNTPPAVTSTPPTGVQYNQPYSYTIAATDAENDALTYSAPTLPAWLTFNPATQILSGTPSSTHLGMNPVSLAVYDGLTTATQQFNIAVFAPTSTPLVLNGSFELGSPTPTSWTLGGSATNSTNVFQHGARSLMVRSPTTTIPTRQTIPLQTGTAYRCSVWIHAARVTNSAVVFNTGYTNGGQFVVSSNTGWTLYSGTFTAANTSCLISISALSSSFGGTAYVDNVTIKLASEPDAPPVITSIPETQALQDSAYSYSLLAADRENLPLVYSGVIVPAWLSFNVNNGLLSGIPDRRDVGSHLVALRVSNGMLSSTQTFSIAVTALGSNDYDDWASTNLLSGTATDDQDGDGRNNFYEYALGGNPNNPANESIDPVIVTTSGVLEYRHNRRKDVTNLTYQLEARSDLMTGTWSNVVFGGVHTTVKNSEYDTVIHPVPLVGTNSFIRLKITEQ